MIFINPRLDNAAKTAKEHGKPLEITNTAECFPHLFNERGELVRTIYIYSSFNDIVVETIEADAGIIKQKVLEFVANRVEALRAEISTKQETLKALEALFEK